MAGRLPVSVVRHCEGPHGKTRICFSRSSLLAMSAAGAICAMLYKERTEGGSVGLPTEARTNSWRPTVALRAMVGNLCV